MMDGLVPVVGSHVVVGHVAESVHLRHGEWLAWCTTRVRQCRPVHVPVAAVRRVALCHLVQSRMIHRSHCVIPTRILHVQFKQTRGFQLKTVPLRTVKHLFHSRHMPTLPSARDGKLANQSTSAYRSILLLKCKSRQQGRATARCVHPA